MKLADAVAELRDAQTALDDALANWWRVPPHAVGAAAVRWVHARHALRRAVTEPERAS